MKKLTQNFKETEVFPVQIYNCLLNQGYLEAVFEWVGRWNDFKSKLAEGTWVYDLTKDIESRWLQSDARDGKQIHLWDYVSDKFKVDVAETRAFIAEQNAKDLEAELEALEAKVAELEAKLQEQAAKPKEPAESEPFDRNNPSHVFKAEVFNCLPFERRGKLLDYWNNTPPAAIYNRWRVHTQPRVNSFRSTLTDAAKVYVLEERVSKDREIIRHLARELEKQQKQITDNINALNRVYDEE